MSTSQKLPGVAAFTASTTRPRCRCTAGRSGLPSTTTAIRRPTRFCWYRIFLSVVKSTSKPASSAALSNAPLDNLSQPRGIASTTTCPRSERAMLRGVPWSKRMSLGGHRCLRLNRGPRFKALGREVQDRVDLFPGDGEFLHHFFHPQARFQIRKDRSDRHPRVLEHPRTANPARNALHGGTL
jgi:hypothetical protein